MAHCTTTAMAAAALVLSFLGWTPVGDAAREAVFPSNSIGTAQLKTGAVTSAKIRDRSVRSVDIERRSIVAAHIRPGTLLASSFKPGQLPAGPKGDKGDEGEKGAKGDPGLAALQIVQSSGVNLAANGLASATATCPSGKRVLGGGGHVAGAVAGAGLLWQSLPATNTSWRVAYKSSGPSATIWAYAVCATVAP